MLKPRNQIWGVSGFIIGSLLVLFIYFISWLSSCGMFALICWALNVFGMTTLGSWTVEFSWKTATAFWIILMIMHSLKSWFTGKKLVSNNERHI